MSNLKIYAVQMTSGDVPEINLEFILSAIQKIPQETTLAVVSFPENCLFVRLGEGASIPWFEVNNPYFSQIAEAAKRKNVHVHLGSVPLQEGEKRFNATLWITPDGRIEVVYRKMHLFDIQLNDGTKMMESDLFQHGPAPAMVQLGDWKIGLSICYDLRFSELYSQYAQHECDLILVPSAFLVPTGQAHWEVLLRSRAIESQAYVVAAAQAGLHQNAAGSRRQTYGNSLILHPWGGVLARGSEAETGFYEALLDKAEIRKVRSQIPMKAHRRVMSTPRLFIAQS